MIIQILLHILLQYLMGRGQTPQTIIKPLLILTLISAIISLGLLIMIIIRNYSGFGTYSSTLVCNAYLTIKYQTDKHIAYRTRFLLLLSALICLAIDSIFSIRSFITIKGLQQLNRGQDYKWAKCELYVKYICQSLAIMFILPIFIFYMSITVEEGKCLNSISVDWILFIIGSSIALVLSIICWVIIVKYIIAQSQQGEQEQKQRQRQRNINHNQLREKQAQMKNIFQIEGQEMYKTNRSYSNREAVQPLMVQNSPIPLMYPQQNTIITPKQRPKEELQIYNNPNMNSPLQNSRKKSAAHTDRSRVLVKQKSQLSQLIEKKKEKFRQINPFKISSMSPSKMEGKAEQEQIYEQVDDKNKMKNLPRTYHQYIKQSKRPKRVPDIPKLEDILKTQIMKSMAKDEANEKPFLKKYRKARAKQSQLKEGEIQFIDSDEEQVIQPNRQAQLFYHKPRIEKKTNKKRKALFEDDTVVESNPFMSNQIQWKEVIINKLKDGKSNSKSKLNLNQILDIGANQQKKKMPQILTKQDLLLTFLKSKYLTQNEQ